MTRYLSLALILAWPLGAEAFQSFSRTVDGVTIIATRSAREACGVDLEIRLPNADQRFVIIEYTYNGTFESFTFNGVYKGGSTPPSLRATSKGGVINASMGQNTYLGLSYKTFADPHGLYCLRDWSFNFIAQARNISQSHRDSEAERQRKERARQEEIERGRAERAENKRRAEEMQRRAKQTQEQARIDNAIAYRSRPENARCLISISDERSTRESIALCEQYKARKREEDAREQAAALEAQRKREDEERRRAEQEAQFRASDELYERQKADFCGTVADDARQAPEKIRQLEAQNSMQSRQRAAQLKQWLTAVQAQCPAFATPTPTAPIQAQASQPPREETKEERKVRLFMEGAKALGLIK